MFFLETLPSDQSLVLQSHHTFFKLCVNEVMKSGHASLLVQVYGCYFLINFTIAAVVTSWALCAFLKRVTILWLSQQKSAS